MATTSKYTSEELHSIYLGWLRDARVDANLREDFEMEPLPHDTEPTASEYLADDNSYMAVEDGRMAIVCQVRYSVDTATVLDWFETLDHATRRTVLAGGMRDQGVVQDEAAKVAGSAKADGRGMQEARRLVCEHLVDQNYLIPKKLKDASGKPLPQLVDAALSRHYDP